MICPRCGSKEVRPHCRDYDSRQAFHCDWIVCKTCNGYGKPDGSRWVEKAKA